MVAKKPYSDALQSPTVQDGSEGAGMVIAIVAAAAAAVVAAAALFVFARRSRARERALLQDAVRELDDSLGGMARRLEESLQRSQVARGSRGEVGLSLDLDEMLLQIAREAATRTGADAAAVRVLGTADEPAVACVGARDAAALLETTVPPIEDGRARAVTMDLTLLPTLDADAEPYRSALVVPVLEDGVETGAIAGYASEAEAFRPEHAKALEELAAEAADGISTARRFTAFRRRTGSQRPATALARPSATHDVHG
jgi:GAF domain-containing protein